VHPNQDHAASFLTIFWRLFRGYLEVPWDTQKANENQSIHSRLN
jgi:hypothetical protein